MNGGQSFRALEFFAELARDSNWLHEPSGHFELYARKEILDHGSSARPVAPLDIPCLVHGSGFHGMPTKWWEDVKRTARRISGRWDSGFKRKSPTTIHPVRVLFWDDRFALPVKELAVSVKNVKNDLGARLRRGELSPMVNRLQDEAGEDIDDQFVILIPMPVRAYWGRRRLEWLLGAFTHESAHVWTSWIARPWAMKHFWGVLDETTAVWSEWHHSGCKTALDYAAAWGHLDSLSLYGVTVDERFPVPERGYYQFPFLTWLNERVAPKKKRGVPDFVTRFWESASDAPSGDPWRHMDSQLAKYGGLKRLYGEYCGEAFTCAFRKKYLPGSDEPNWYLKCAQEAYTLEKDHSLELKEQKLSPLSKRAYLLRMDGVSRWSVKLTSRCNDFVMHVIEDDGKGGRSSARVVAVDDTPPIEVSIPPATHAILVVANTALASQDDIKSYRITADRFDLAFTAI